MIARRAVLAGGAALMLTTRTGATSPRLPIRPALDAAAAEQDPVRALELLRPLDAHGLLAGERLDLVTARAGLTVDVALVRLGLDPRAKGPPRDAAHAALLLCRKLGDGMDVRAAEARLEAERRRCSLRADALFTRLGTAGRDTGARFSTLWRDPAQRYPSAEAALADMNGWLDYFRTHTSALIGPVPAWCSTVAALASGKPGTRILPTPNAPGGYVPDLARLADRPRFTIPSMVAHELLPGHMVQMPIEAAANPHPLRLEYAPGYAEGWGIYAERRVADAGVYASDPLAELGYLHWRLFRIGRALVDLAIHTRGVSLAEARARLVAWHGEPAYFAPFDADLARIVQEPMTRAAEMLFALAMEDGARRRAHESLVRYHHALLVDGRMRSDDIARDARRIA